MKRVPWLVRGDFNEIVGHHEKLGGNQRPESQLDAFRSMLDNCHVQDLGFTGSVCTWCNGRVGSQRISERLDYFEASKEW